MRQSTAPAMPTPRARVRHCLRSVFNSVERLKSRACAVIGRLPGRVPRATRPGRRPMTAQALDFNLSTELKTDLKQWRTRALGVGIAGAVLCLIGLISNPFQFYRSYLWSYLLVLGL